MPRFVILRNNAVGISADFVYAVAQLKRHAQPTPEHAMVILTGLAHVGPMLIGPGVSTVVAPTQHDFGVNAQHVPGVGRRNEVVVFQQQKVAIFEQQQKRLRI